MSLWTPSRLLDLVAMSPLRHVASVTSVLEYLPIELFPPLFMGASHGTQSDFEGHDAHLALCPPASGRHDAKTSYGDLTSCAGWAGCPACPERLPQVSLIQVAS